MYKTLVLCGRPLFRQGIDKLGFQPSLSSYNSKFHLLMTEVSVQEAPVSLACWVGIPVYVVLIGKFYLLLTEASVQGAPVSLACGLESHFI